MTGIYNNLYPPIVDTLMPAFIYNQNCKIYFSISDFNTIGQEVGNDGNESEINKDAVQVIVRRQKDNKSVLNDSKYPSQIMLKTLYLDYDKQDDKRYYIQISSEDIQNGFNLNQYYKVQIRFTNTIAEAPVGQMQSLGIDNWINNNIQYFSEWSQIILIYGISQPVLILDNDMVENTITIYDELDIHLSGYVNFINSKDTETLNQYKVYLYDSQTNQLILESENIYTNKSINPNQIYYNLKYNLQYNHYYNLKFIMLTKNLYTFESQIYKLKVTQTDKQDLQLDVEIQTNEQDGSAEIVIFNIITQVQEEQPEPEEKDWKYYYEDAPQYRVNGKTLYLSVSGPRGDFKSSFVSDNNDTLVLFNYGDPRKDLSQGTIFIIKRSSSKDNFHIWQTVDTFKVEQPSITKLIWSDYTVEAGIWYKYYIIRKDFLGDNQSAKILDPVMVMMQDIFLSADNKQLRIRFDPEISNFSIKTSESLIETLGSKYPFIRRNGNIGYKTFSLSGTISFFTDLKSNLFKASPEDLYGDNINLYSNYNEDHKITPYNDYIREKEFRNRVIDFLYNDDIKLFRSLTQGNMLVKIMNISLTPNNTLGRMIYSFSCTLYEIDQNTYEKYKDYNVIIKGYKRSIKNEI